MLDAAFAADTRAVKPGSRLGGCGTHHSAGQWRLQPGRGSGDAVTFRYRAAVLDDLRIPPGNQLEPLHCDRRGQHSIRINRQWRVCFVWTAHGPAAVEIVDYH